MLMEHLPPVGWASVATKQALALLRSEIRGDMAHEAGLTRVLGSGDHRVITTAQNGGPMVGQPSSTRGTTSSAKASYCSRYSARVRPRNFTWTTLAPASRAARRSAA